MALSLLDPFYYIEGRYMKNGKGGGKAPAAPDPATTAAAQTATNKETAYWNAVLNNVNQVTPYGNLTYTQNTPAGATSTPVTYDNDAYNKAMEAWNQAPAQTQGWNQDPNRNNQTVSRGPAPTLEQFRTGGGSSGTNLDSPPSFTSTITLSPEQQKILDSQNRQDIALGGLAEGQIGRISDSISTPYSYGGIGNEFSSEDIATQQKNAEDAYFNRLNPQFAQDEESLRTRLINQGIGQGSQAYQREMDSFNQMKNDARSQAVLAGQQYGSTAQQQALQRRNQGIQEYDAQRNAPLNEYIGLTSGTQVTNPQFNSQSYQGSQPVDYAGLVNQNYQNQMGQYNAKQASSNNTMSSLFGLGGSFLGAAGAAGGFGKLFAGLSDRRLKTDIELVGKENGLPIYKFRYDQESDYVRHLNLPDKTYIGCMADDVEKIVPEAVFETDGWKRVNYAMIGVEMREAV